MKKCNGKLIRIYKTKLDMELYIMFKSTLYKIVQLFTDSTYILVSNSKSTLLLFGSPGIQFEQ